MSVVKFKRNIFILFTLNYKLREMKLVEIAIFTRKVREHIEFYEKFFDVKPKWHNERVALFELAGIKFLIHETNETISRKNIRRETSEAPADEDHIAFAVEDLEKACARLKNAGIGLEVSPRDYNKARKRKPTVLTVG
jgi:catechol 2,3-dioxygenase-like lactoylglutathione lyase family enzyme